MSQLEIDVIITAGGIGNRMGSTIPKQFLPLADLPILMQTMRRFHAAIPRANLILTLPQTGFQAWHTLCKQHNFQIAHTTIDGGKERFNSIQNAIRLAKGDIIFIHDGVRPLFSEKIIEQALQQVAPNLGLVPVVSSIDSLREVQGEKSTSVARDKYKQVQTPQAFMTLDLKQAYQVEYEKHFTDDASVFEFWGGKIKLIDGNRENIKITEPHDLQMATIFWENLGFA